MSLRQSYAAWRIYDVSALEKLVLLALADYADDNGGRIYPQVATLAEKTNQNKRTVQRCLKGLEDKTYLTIVRGTGKSHSDYTLTLPRCLLAEYDAKVAKRRLKSIGREQDKIVENHFEQLHDMPF